ncbi:putative NUDIX family hydrolase [Aspergillus undulatus]|uniref:putative NUDIX family hydrolase n=1 Tax=Aspergillus undulatus TaxID=1810928 RepID=UPI003CCD824B
MRNYLIITPYPLNPAPPAPPAIFSKGCDLGLMIQRFKLRQLAFNLRLRLPVLTRLAMSTTNNPNHGLGSLPVSCPPELSIEALSQFPAFRIWFSTLQQSLSRQQHPSHEFHKDPYALRKIDVQAVDFFGGGRLGFVKIKADISNSGGEYLPGSVFLRGGSVGMLLLLQPDDVPSSSEDDKWAVLTVQPRIPAGSLAFSEIPAGMLDDSGAFAGKAAEEIEEETGLGISQSELVDMTSLALQSSAEPEDSETLQKAVYPSAGGSDEFIPLFLCDKRIPRKDIEALQGKLTGLRQHGEKITLKVVPLKDLWKEGIRDGKTLAAWALYMGLKRENKL